jgi:hypothetical protein
MYANLPIALDSRRMAAFAVAFAVELILLIAFVIVMLAPGTTARPGTGPDRPAPPTLPSQFQAGGRT